MLESYDRSTDLRAPPGAEAAAEPAREGLAAVLELVVIAVELPRFRAAATAVATELATRLDCERVSVGFERRGGTRVEALSHSARFAGNASLIRSIESAMDEALDQRAVITTPGEVEGAPRIVRAHEALATIAGSGSVCTVPFGDEQGMYGAITVERESGGGFDRPSVELCEAVANHPNLAGITSTDFETIEGPTRVCRGLLATT